MARLIGSLEDKPWRKALRLAVSERYDTDELDRHGRPKRRQALLLMARKLVQAGMDGDISAIKEAADRLDGKAIQGVSLDVSVAVTAIERRIVRPSDLLEAAMPEILDLELEPTEPTD